MVDVMVVTGGGDVVQRLGADARTLSSALETARRLSYAMLRDIDPYGDTVFNRLQITVFLSQWHTLVQEAGLAEHSAARAVARMAEFVRDNPHHYLKFEGD